MKTLSLLALLLVTMACGKKTGSRSIQPEREINPITGEITTLRSTAVAEIYIDEVERSIRILHVDVNSPRGDGFFECPLNVTRHTRWAYDVISDGRTLFLMRGRSGEYYTRAEMGQALLGSWTQIQYTSTMKIQTTLIFPHQRSMQIFQQCWRR